MVRRGSLITFFLALALINKRCCEHVFHEINPNLHFLVKIFGPKIASHLIKTDPLNERPLNIKGFQQNVIKR